MIDATLYRELSDAHTVVQIQAGMSISDNFPGIDISRNVVLVNGRESSGDYIAQEGDIVVIRSVPHAISIGALTAITLIVGVVVSAVMVGISVYKMRKQVEELEEKLKNLSDTVQNVPYLRGANNSIATGKSQPYLIGEHLFTPYLLTGTFSKLSGVDGADQYFYAILENGFNSQVIRKLYCDDVSLKDWGGALTVPQEGIYAFDASSIFYDANSLIEVAQDGNDFATALFNKRVSTEAPGAQLKKADATDYEDLIYTLPQHTRAAEVCIMINGLRAYSDSGDKINRTITVIPEYQLVDGGAWTAFTFNQNGTPSNTFTRNVMTQLRFVARIDFSYAAVASLTNPVKVRLRCTTNAYSGTASDDVYAQWIQSEIYDPIASESASAFVDEEIIGDTERALSTLVGLKIKVTASNQDKLSKINCISSGVARTWNGTIWSAGKVPTSNPAAWLLEVLTSPTHLASQCDDSEIDLDSFGELYEYCETNSLAVDTVLSDGDIKESVLATILGSCFSILYRDIYGKMSVATDEAKPNAIALFNTQNVMSFENEKSLERRTDGIKISYISRDGGYVQSSYLVMRSGVTRTSDSIIRDVSVQGIVEYEHIVKYARRMMAIEALRPKSTTIGIGKEGTYFTPLSKVLIQHPSLKVGLGSAEIKSVIDNGTHITGVVLYEPVTYDPANVNGYGVVIGCVGADYYTPRAVAYTADNTRPTELEFVTPIILSAPVIPHRGDVLSYGTLSSGTFDLITTPMLIAGISPNDSGFALTLVDYDEAVYSVGDIPEYIPNFVGAKPTVSVPGTVPTANQDDIVDAITKAGAALSIKPGAIVRDRAGILSPDSVDMSSALRNGTAYPGRFTVEISGDGDMYHERYKSITDEASHTFEVPAKTNVPGCVAYYPADDVSPYPDDPAGTTYLGKDFLAATGFVPVNCTLSVNAGRIIMTATGANARVLVSTHLVASKTVRLQIKRIAGVATNRRCYNSSATVEIYSKDWVEDTHIQDVYFPASAGGQAVIEGGNAGSAAGDVYAIDFIYIGTGKYLDGSLQNQISDSYDATIYGCTPDGAGGLIGDGINDYVRTVDVVPITENMTRVCVFKPGALPATSKIFLSHGYYNVSGEYFWLAADGTICVTRNIAGWTSANMFPGFNATANTEYKFAFVSRGLYLDMYVNGSYVSTLTFAYAQATTARKIALLGYEDANYNAAGTISDPRLYYGLLTAEQIKQLSDDPTDPALYTVDVRTRLYASGGFTTRIGEAHTTVSADPSTAAEYLGIGILTGLDREAYTAATVDEDGTITVIGAVTEVFAGDTMVNYSSSGGVTTLGLYKWSGTAWVKTTNIKDLTLAMNDLFGLSVAGISIADATVVSLLIAKQILAENVDVTGQLTVQAGGRMRYETGAGVQKRCVQLADEKIDFIDIPGTTPASAEQLRFRFGRLGVGPQVLADGKLLANIENEWSGEITVNGEAVYDSCYMETVSGELRIAYSKLGTIKGIGERIFDGRDWGPESLVTSIRSINPAYGQTKDGKIRVAYNIASTGSLVEQIYSGGAWGEAIEIQAGASAPKYLRLLNGETILVYKKTSSGYIAMRSLEGSAWVNETILLSVSGTSYSIIQSYDGKMRIAIQKTSDGVITEYISDGGPFVEGDTVGTGYSGAYVQYVSGELKYLYSGSTGYLYEVQLVDDAWGDPIVLVGIIGDYPSTIQTTDGAYRVAYSAGVTGYLKEVTLQRYARVGAGIVAKGGDVTGDGKWIKLGDGTLIYRRLFTMGNGSTYTFPAEVNFNSTPVIQVTDAHDDGTVRIVKAIPLSATQYKTWAITYDGVGTGPRISLTAIGEYNL